MVKCLIKIKTKVNVHLRMINHCCRDVRVRIVSLGPRILTKAPGSLPLLPADTAAAFTGLESLRDSAHSTPVRCSSHTDTLMTHPAKMCTAEGQERTSVIADELYSPAASVLPTPVSDPSAESILFQENASGNCRIEEEREREVGALAESPEPGRGAGALPGGRERAEREQQKPL